MRRMSVPGKTSVPGNPPESRRTRIVLVGQPNCGKSTLFNEVAGYRSMTSNFPGSTVEYTQSRIRILTATIDIVDLPGVYSLTSLDEAASATQHYLLNDPVDAIVNVMDASLIPRSLELTLQLLELEIPMVLCLNMIDEAERKGVRIDTEKLSQRLQIPVVATVAARGRGVRDLFWTALKTARTGRPGAHIPGSRDVEEVVDRLIRFLDRKEYHDLPFSHHLLATKLLESDPYFEKKFVNPHPEVFKRVKTFKEDLARKHGKTSDAVISDERHALSMSIFEETAEVGAPRRDWRDKVDNVLMHNLWGYVFLVLVFFSFFHAIFHFGSWLETPLLGFFERINRLVAGHLDPQSIWGGIVSGSLHGIGGGIAVVVPYLFPFLMGLSLLEDVGYLPRVAFLLDSFMHRIGLHGKAAIPVLLGYGCNVPAVMATRILESPRDRFIAALAASLVPCSARMTIIFGLVGALFGGGAALALYGLNALVVVISGMVLSRLLPEVSPGMFMEIPVYRFPRIKVALLKTWMRLKDFFIIAWPLLIAGSVVLSLIDHFRLTDPINRVLAPVTGVLGLPQIVGMTLVFGILRKELSMLMLFQALGTTDVAAVLDRGQILVFTVFVVFYVPCLATMGVLAKQIGVRKMILVVIFMLVLALVLGAITRGIAPLFV